MCVERARRLRRLNPSLKLYVLYGGDLAEADRFREALDEYSDDFYAFSADWSAERKWLHGDQMIATWHRDRGANLPWDTIFIAQWDILMLEPLDRLCAGLRRVAAGTVRAVWRARWLSVSGHRHHGGVAAVAGAAINAISPRAVSACLDVAETPAENVVRV